MSSNHLDGLRNSYYCIIMTLRRLLLFLLVCFTPALSPAEPVDLGRIDRDFSKVDAAVRGLPPARSIAHTIELLDGAASNDWERARAVYIWLTENIAYDTASYFSGRAAVTDAAGVFRSGKSVCQGYAELFVSLAEGLGLEAVMISGYAKGYGYSEDRILYRTNHAWNGVRINGEWHLFDATWGAGHVDGRKFVKDFSGFWFDPHPELYLWTHLPEEERWQLTSDKISMDEYFSRKYYMSSYFESLYSLGFSDTFVLGALENNLGLPSAYRYADYHIQFTDAPLAELLEPGEPVRIVMSVPGVESAAFINNGEFSFFEYTAGLLEGTISPKAGKLTVAALITYRGQESYWSILEYRVR
jgi:hypothetical protein